MLKSMYSGISGMKANQTKMDVVGNNVANVGTTSFKKSSTRFSDTLYQTSMYSGAPSEDIGGTGGINPAQIGMGTKVSGIFKNTVRGNIQTTGRSSDLAIDGDGYFKVQIGKDKFAYTRDGSFNIDKNGDLVTAAGYKVVDTDNKPINIPTDKDGRKVLSYKISSEGEISLILSGSTNTVTNPGDGEETKPGEGEGTNPGEGTNTYAETQEQAKNQKLNIAVFKNPEGLEALSGNLYGVSVNSGNPIENATYGNIEQGAIEMSNVDLSEEFTEMIVTTRAFQASSKVITTSDELLQEIINLKR